MWDQGAAANFDANEYQPFLDRVCMAAGVVPVVAGYAFVDPRGGVELTTPPRRLETT